jgi:hypothetical protein
LKLEAMISTLAMSRRHIGRMSNIDKQRIAGTGMFTVPAGGEQPLRLGPLPSR